MQEEKRKQQIILFILGIIPVIWLSLIIAPNIEGGLIDIIKKLTKALDNPFRITICENSLKTVLFLLVVYVIAILIYYSSRKNYRRNEEYGSAKWGSAKKICKKYIDKNNNKNHNTDI